VIASRCSGDRTEGVLTQLHGGKQFVAVCGRDGPCTIDGGVNLICVHVQARLCITGQVAQNLLVVLVSQSVGSTVGCEVHEVDVRVRLFNVVDLEGEVVRLINDQREVLVVQILSSDLSTTLVRTYGDFRFFDDSYGVTLCRDLTEISNVIVEMFILLLL
jgi:hypothetical protein